jgi:tape measure domain-containing protein
MAGGLGSVNIRFRINLAELSTQMQTASRIFAAQAASFKKAAQQMNEAGQTLTTYLTLPIAALGVTALKSFGDLEALQKGLISVMGSSTAAAAEFEKLKEVAKLPGLGLEEAVRGSVNLQAAGFSADQARESLLAFGNALATVGKGKNELNLVILALTQLNNKSTGFAQDLRQLTEQLPQLRGALTEAFGTSDSQAIADLGFTGREIVETLTKEFAKLPKVTGGFNNALENASDAAKISLAQLGESINKAFDVEGKINKVAEVVQGAVDAFKSWSPEAQKLALTIAGVAASIGPLLIGIAGIAKVVSVAATGASVALNILGGAFINLGRAIAFAQANAIAITAVLGAAYIAYTFFKKGANDVADAQKKQADAQKTLTQAQIDASANQKTLNDLTQKASQHAAEQITRVKQLFATGKNLKVDYKDRAAALRELNKISPEYFGNLNTETINTAAATKALLSYNEALLKGALAKAAQEKITEVYKTQLESQMKAAMASEAANNAAAEAGKVSVGVSEAQSKITAQTTAGVQKFSGILNSAANKQTDSAGKQIEFLNRVFEENKKYLDLLIDIEEFDKKNKDAAKPGTIKYYQSLIDLAKKQQTEVVETSAAYTKLQEKIDGYQKKIDAIEGKRVKVQTIFEIAQKDGFDIGKTKLEDLKVDLPELKTPESYDAHIAVLEKIRDTVAETSETYGLLNIAIAELQYDKANKFGEELVDSFDQSNASLGYFGKKLQTASVGFHQFTADMIAAAADFNAQFTALVESFKETALIEFAEGFASIISGTGSIGTLFSGLISVVGDFLVQLGKALIQAAIVAEAFKDILALGAGAIPIGLAAIIVGSVMKNASKNSFAGSFADGGIVGGHSYYGDKLMARVNSGEMILNQDQQRRLAQGIQPISYSLSKIQIDGVTRITGRDLDIIFTRYNKEKGRTD